MPTVLFVCTANQCRSVIAEHLMRARLLSRGIEWDVVSAGTHVRPGTGAHELAVQALAAQGVEVDPGWRSTQVTPASMGEADLVLTATHAHLRDVLRHSPRATRRSFVMSQFARLLEPELDVDSATEPSDLVLRAARGRGLMQPRPQDRDDLGDPIGQPLAGFRACAATIDESLELIAGRITAVDSTRSATA